MRFLTYCIALVIGLMGIYFLYQAYHEYFYSYRFQAYTAKAKGTVTRTQEVLVRAESPVSSGIRPVLEFRDEHGTAIEHIAFEIKSAPIGKQFNLRYDPNCYSAKDPEACRTYANEDPSGSRPATITALLNWPLITVRSVSLGVFFLIISLLLLVIPAKAKAKHA